VEGVIASWLTPGCRRILLLAALVGCLAAGCGEENVSRPQETPTNVITAYYQTDEAEERAPVALDGERVDLEWGSEFTPERPFTHVRLSADNGSGQPGATRYLSMKAVYTSRHLYLLLQWRDLSPDIYKDIFVYAGPALAAPIINCYEVGGEIVCDSTYRTGPQDSLLSPAWWQQVGEDDKLAIAFEIMPTTGNGMEFSEAGCQVACHPAGAPRFGTLESGRLDVWYWLAGRTNPVRDLFIAGDDPDDADHGLPGYLDDWFANPGAGLVPDPGFPAYEANFEPGAGVPQQVYRRSDDRFHNPQGICENRFGGECLANNGVRMEYLWRENATAFYRPFNARDTLLQSNVPSDPRKWVPGDLVAGYRLNYPSESRADVHGSGGHLDEAGVWTLEVARALDTGDPDRDVIFDPDSGDRYVFTIAVFNASVQEHWGSEPLILEFGPKPPEEEEER